MRVMSIIFQIIMEKSSEKLIHETSPLKNRFRDMFSEVNIKLPSTLETKQKPHNLVLEMQSYFDRSGQNVIEGRGDQQDPLKKVENNKNGKNNLCNFTINVPLKTKNSSLKREHAIVQKFICLMEQKIQPVQKCLKDFENNDNEILKDAFKCIKNYQTSQNYIFNNIQTIRKEQKVPIMVNILVKMEQMRVRSFLQKLIQFQRDSVLFGLSNTVGDLKDNSLLKLESQSRYLGLQTVKQLKQMSKIEKQFCKMNMSKKINQQYGSESLSALILNHNELKISPEFNQIYPNIPKSNKSINDKFIASQKQIVGLQLYTKKKIQSSKKLTDSKDLPLDSRKNINDSNQEKVQNQVTINNQEKTANRPITFTYILNNLDFNGALQSREGVNPNKMNDYNIQKWNAIQSQFQNPNRNICMQECRILPQKRSISLQIRPLKGLYISPSKPEKTNNQGNSNRICNNQYYNQDNCNRQNLMRAKCNFKDAVQTKPRAKSAAPRVTFNFCSSNNAPSSPLVQNKAQVQQERKIKYQEPDFIIQRSLIHDRNTHLAQIGTREKQPKQNRLQVISPSNRRDQKNAARKLKTQQKESIKQRLLPPAFNDYYHKQNQPQNKARVPILSNSNFSTQPTYSQQKPIKKRNFKQMKKVMVNQAYCCELQQQKQVGCQPTFCNKIQLQNTPKINHNKEKILVTYSNKNIL